MKRKLRWWWIIGASTVTRLLFIGLTFPYMWVYATFINKGHDEAFYKDYFFDNRAWISTGLGIPVFFLIGIWFSRKMKFRIYAHCFWFWVVYTLFDIPIEMLVGDLENFWQQLTVAHVTKLGAIMLGAAYVNKSIKRINPL